MQTLTDPLGQRTRFTYDAAGQLIEQTGSDGLSIRYQLDTQGWPLQVTEDANGPHPITLQFERDAIGRLLHKHTPQTHTRYEWDKADRLTRIRRWAAPQEPSHAVTTLGTTQPPLWDEHRFTYDPYGNLQQEHASHWPQISDPAKVHALHPTGKPQHTSTLSHRHDALGVRTATTLAQGHTLHYLHYGSGHLHQIHLDGRIISDIERNAEHQEITRSQGCLSTQWQRDGLGRPLWQLTSYGAANTQVLDIAMPAPEGQIGQAQIHSPWQTQPRWQALMHPRTPWTAISKGWRWDAAGELIARRDAIQGEQHLGFIRK